MINYVVSALFYQLRTTAKVLSFLSRKDCEKGVVYIFQTNANWFNLKSKGDQAFTVVGLKLWNRLRPFHIRSATCW